MKPSELDQLRETAHRRPLTTAERARLQACVADAPAQREAWKEEVRLTGLLTELPNAPIASNFTSQVLRRLEQEARTPTPSGVWSEWLRVLWPLPRFAAVALALLVLPLGYRQYQSSRRSHMAASLASITHSVNEAAHIAQLPPIEILQDYDAIERLRQARAVADEELLAGLDMAGGR